VQRSQFGGALILLNKLALFGNFQLSIWIPAQKNLLCLGRKAYAKPDDTLFTYNCECPLPLAARIDSARQRLSPHRFVDMIRLVAQCRRILGGSRE